MKILLIVVLLIASGTSHSTTWSRTSVTDPISGKPCDVHEIASYGSYIYQWESKYDGVYWPFIDARWRWDCRESGYISFGSDFSDLTEEEVERISDYLSNPASRYGGPFERMEAIYKLRNKDYKFWAWFARVEAYWHQSQADHARRDSIPLLERHIETLAPGFELVQVYFVLGDYYRRFDDAAKAKEYFALARAVQWTDDEGKPQTGSEYIEKLIQGRLEMMQRLAP